MIDWLRRLLGGDTPFVSPAALSRVARERDEALELAEKRRVLLDAIAKPHTSDATERQVLKRIRSHLQESARG